MAALEAEKIDLFKTLKKNLKKIFIFVTIVRIFLGCLEFAPVIRCGWWRSCEESETVLFLFKYVSFLCELKITEEVMKSIFFEVLEKKLKKNYYKNNNKYI